jgi:hypothetical protein
MKSHPGCFAVGEKADRKTMKTFRVVSLLKGEEDRETM